jgi:hypothetical protein
LQGPVSDDLLHPATHDTYRCVISTTGFMSAEHNVRSYVFLEKYANTCHPN